MSFFLPQPLQAAVSDRKRFPVPGQVHSALVNSYGTWYNKFYCIAPEKPRCASQCARRHPGAQPETALFSSGPCLKNVNIPKRRVFFRHTALIFLAIHKVLPQTAGLFPPYCVDFPCNTQSIAASNRLVWRKNPSPSGTFPIFKQGLAFPFQRGTSLWAH